MPRPGSPLSPFVGRARVAVLDTEEEVQSWAFSHRFLNDAPRKRRACTGWGLTKWGQMLSFNTRNVNSLYFS